MLFAGELSNDPSIDIIIMTGNYSLSSWSSVITLREHCTAPNTDRSLEDDDIPNIDDSKQRCDMFAYQ